MGSTCTVPCCADFDMLGEPPRRQVVFLARHAQSRWNKAQDDMALVSMMWERDHGLSHAGRIQAELLRPRIEASQNRLNSVSDPEQRWFLQHLLRPDVVYASPFTRTICTACIGFGDLLPGKELVLVKEAREQKNLGGKDSTGVAVGADIPVRAVADMEQIYQDVDERQREQALKEVKRVRMDTSGVTEKWWGDIYGDDGNRTDERCDKLAEHLRGTRGNGPGGGGTSIVVGHSLFFRNLFRSFLRKPSQGWQNMTDPYSQVALSLTTHTLPFCGVVGCLFEWDAEGKASIVKAVPILDTHLQEAEPKHMDNVAELRSWPAPERPKGFGTCLGSRK